MATSIPTSLVLLLFTKLVAIIEVIVMPLIPHRNPLLMIEEEAVGDWSRRRREINKACGGGS